MVRALRQLSMLVWLLLVLGEPWSAQAQATAAAQRRTSAVLAASERAHAAGRPDLALRKLSQALAAKPSMQVLLRYAELGLPLGGLDSSSELAARVPRAEPFLLAFSRVERVDSSLEEVRRALLYAAVAEALRADYAASFALVREAGRLQDAATVLCLRTIAVIAAFREQLSVASHALAQARQYLPQDLLVMAELGRVELARGRVNEALFVLGERFGIEPQVLAARRDLAYALLSAGRAQEALDLLSVAREACTASPSCALEAARTALSAERSDTALSYARARLQQGVDLDALFLVAEAHVRRGEFADARSAYGEILRLHPSSLRAQQALEQLPTANGTSNAATP